MLKNNLKNPSDGFNMKLSFLTLFDSFLFDFRHFVFYNLIVVLVFFFRNDSLWYVVMQRKFV